MNKIKIEFHMLSINIEYTDLVRIYENYESAMSRRRPDGVLEEDRFITHIMNHSYYIQYEDSYIFGQELNGYFIPTHFSPSSIKEGYKFIKMLKYCDNIAFVVTDDLTKMLKKAGFITLPFKFKKEFRGEIVNKKISFTSIKSAIIFMAKFLFNRETSYIG